MKRNFYQQIIPLSLCVMITLQLSGCGARTYSETDSAAACEEAPAADTAVNYEAAEETAEEAPSNNEPSYDEYVDNAYTPSNETALYDDYTQNDDFDPNTQTANESYAQIAENHFIQTQKECISTFSIDVDTASYGNVRRYLSNYMLPPSEAVRTEEFINYFDYDYPNPKGNTPFSITQEVGDCPWNLDHKLLLLGLQGKQLDPNEAAPSNLVFLLDVSGSMDQPNKLPLLKKSFSILTSKLKPTDSVSIVTYAGSTEIVLNGAHGDDQKSISAALDALFAGGGTAGSSGLKLAYDVAEKHLIKGGNNRIILATDGDFNVGPSSEEELLRLIRLERDKGIYLTALGLGMGNYKDDRIETIADNGNGNYFYIDSLKEANKVFNEDLAGTLYTIAKDVKIQVEFNPNEVEAYRLIGYENRLLNKEDFEDDTVDAGEIGAGHTVTALYEIIPAKEHHVAKDTYYEDTDVQVGDEYGLVKLRYKEPDGDTSKLITTLFSPKLTTSTNNLLFAGAVAEYCMLLKDSNYTGNASYDHVLHVVDQYRATDDYKDEFYELIQNTKYLCNE